MESMKQRRGELSAYAIAALCPVLSGRMVLPGWEVCSATTVCGESYRPTRSLCNARYNKNISCYGLPRCLRMLLQANGDVEAVMMEARQGRAALWSYVPATRCPALTSTRRTTTGALSCTWLVYAPTLSAYAVYGTDLTWLVNNPALSAYAMAGTVLTYCIESVPAEEGNFRMVEMLLEQGADKNAKDRLYMCSASTRTSVRTRKTGTTTAWSSCTRVGRACVVLVLERIPISTIASLRGG
eukprot:2005489-Rhodomonas_salina.4